VPGEVMNVHQILYVSKAVRELSDDEVGRIAEVSRQNNAKKNISGLLMFQAGIFLQLLEGDAEAVEDLYQKIAQDPRHGHVTKIFSIDNNERMFAGWSMGLKKIEDIDIRMINEILSWNRLIAGIEPIDNDLIMKMLGRFRNRS